ncbi:hypothetical protein [Paenibacillus radicis (ex Gao et al. 2016)]|uniref:Uncharacterized protein n=1 Tax=Paenibacillus radicis (ex Gao et al. 2016) TaxID=1737354 RepID=A0A917H408_9BACL|nr:hypothetical protein [Paenibacillus radicis (ex Gao et al. 2016)]GGG66897.1 hypothetical protein GCM10010918_21740 [Paenibacillus radicis (ex Gao et al. 2016)]
MTYMTYKDVLGRRSEILKRNIDQMILKDNRQGLSLYESNVYQSMLKKLHHNESALQEARKQDET